MKNLLMFLLAALVSLTTPALAVGISKEVPDDPGRTALLPLESFTSADLQAHKVLHLDPGRSQGQTVTLYKFDTTTSTAAKVKTRKVLHRDPGRTKFSASYFTAFIFTKTLSRKAPPERVRPDEHPQFSDSNGQGATQDVKKVKDTKAVREGPQRLE